MMREEAARLQHIHAQFFLIYESDLNLSEVIDAMVDELDGGEVQNLIE
jgi:hypothetical protein